MWLLGTREKECLERHIFFSLCPTDPETVDRPNTVDANCLYCTLQYRSELLKSPAEIGKRDTRPMRGRLKKEEWRSEACLNIDEEVRARPVKHRQRNGRKTKRG